MKELSKEQLDALTDAIEELSSEAFNYGYNYAEWRVALPTDLNGNEKKFKNSLRKIEEILGFRFPDEVIDFPKR